MHLIELLGYTPDRKARRVRRRNLGFCEVRVHDADEANRAQRERLFGMCAVYWHRCERCGDDFPWMHRDKEDPVIAWLCHACREELKNDR